MPFASPEAPSIALTQLKSVLDQRFAGRVAVELHYLDLDFLSFTGGLPNYLRLTSGQGRLAGSADWFFRQVAFPDAPDNTAAFLERFYFEDEDKEIQLARQFILERRPQVASFLDHLIQKHRLAEADFVGFTSMFFQTMASFAMARRIKAHNPEVVTVIGGAACEAEMGLEFARQIEQLDYVFSGPALVSFPTFVERQLAGDVAGCDEIDGVISKTNLSRCRTGACPGATAEPAGTIRLAGEELDINTNVALDYHAFLDRFEETFPEDELRPMLPFETSRGCSWGEKIACTFCGLNGTAMHYRSMSPDNARAQIRAMFDYVPRCHFFLAVDTIVPTDYLDQAFPEIEAPPGAAIMYEVRPNLTEPQIETLCGAGVLAIQPGIEALSTATLKLMRKGTTAFANLRFLKTCSQFPLRVEWNLLIGSPGEDEATLEKYLHDLPLLTHLHPPGGAFPISFDRFSQYFANPEAHGLDLQPHEHYQFAYPFDPETLAAVAYHFVDRNADRLALDGWLDRLNGVIGKWWVRWENRDAHEKSKLCLIRDDGGLVIYDSRTGEAIDFPITETTAELLEFLDFPRSGAQVESKFGATIADRELAFLKEKRLLFEEAGRLLSLVVI